MSAFIVFPYVKSLFALRQQRESLAEIRLSV
jgi:hypothetical protein